MDSYAGITSRSVIHRYGRAPWRSQTPGSRCAWSQHFAKAAAAILFLLAALACGTSQVAVSQSPLTVTQVVDRMVAANQARARALESYRESRTYTLAYKGFPSDLNAQLVVDMTYTAPDTKRFTVISRRGPKWLQDKVLMRLLKSEEDAQQASNRKNVDLNADNYRFTNLEYHPAADHCSYTVHVEPKIPSKYLYRGTVWIEDRDFAVCRLEAQPAKNPSFWIKSTTISHRYEQIGDFWLPQLNKSVSATRFGGKATLAIEYRNYGILSADSLEQPPQTTDRSVRAR